MLIFHLHFFHLYVQVFAQRTSECSVFLIVICKSSLHILAVSLCWLFSHTLQVSSNTVGLPFMLCLSSFNKRKFLIFK